MAIATERNYYQSLYELAAKVSSASTSDSVLRYIVKKVTQSLDAKGCSLMLLSGDKKFLLHATAYGLSDWYLRKGPLSTDKSISEALEGTPVAVYDAVEDQRIQYREQAKKEGIASILSIPVMLRDEIIGVMRVYTSELYHFTDDDIYFVGAAANLGAIALENVCIYESVEQEYDTFRHDMLEWHAALDNEWMFGDVVVPAEEMKEPPTTPGF
ncbi:MAG: GAF domain-containing protein [Chloroflexi bacterium]|nr:GAF domain-containing protein [Chloroflexota bacterium]